MDWMAWRVLVTEWRDQISRPFSRPKWSRDHFETKMSHYLEWRDRSRDHFRDQNGLDSGLETSIDTKMSHSDLNTTNIFEYHLGLNPKWTKSFLNCHWFDLFQIDCWMVIENEYFPTRTNSPISFSVPPSSGGLKRKEKNSCRWLP